MPLSISLLVNLSIARVALGVWTGLYLDEEVAYV